MRKIKKTDIELTKARSSNTEPAEVKDGIHPIEKYYTTCTAIIGFVVFEILAIVTFVQVDANLQPDNPEVMKWMENYKEGCGEELEMTNSLQNASLNGCGYIVLPALSVVVYMYRWRLVDIQDSHVTSIFAQTLVRAIVFGIPSAIASIPAIVLKKDMVGSSILIMFTNYIIPMGLIAWYSVGGPYDYLVYRAESACSFEKRSSEYEQPPGSQPSDAEANPAVNNED
jgi:hypothetical protein